MSNQEKFTMYKVPAPFGVEETQKRHLTGLGLERAREGK